MTDTFRITVRKLVIEIDIFRTLIIERMIIPESTNVKFDGVNTAFLRYYIC